MSLGALQIGRSALLANQAAIEVTGNNLANIATKGYHRQTSTLAAAGTQQIQQGVFIGRGVQLQSILRQVDAGLEGRLRSAIANESGSTVRQELLTQIEAIQNELSDADVSSQLSAFFNAWSQLSNTPRDSALRSLVVQEGQTLAQDLQQLRAALVDMRRQVDQSIDQNTASANDLLQQIEVINRQITAAESGSSGAHNLRDQRDNLLAELSQYLNISTTEQPSGSVDVYVNSLPIVLNGQSRGLEVRRSVENGESIIQVVISDDGSPINPTAGKIGALITARQDTVVDAIDTVDDFAAQLINQVNRVHSQGQGLVGFTSVTGTARVADANALLSDQAATGLDFVAGHGSFELSLKQKSTSQRVTSTINIDLDGIGGNDTTLNDLAAAINAVNGVSASITSDGRLTIAADGNDFEVSFGQDTSGILASLGINTFFSGGDALDIDVNNVVKNNPDLIATGRSYVDGDNGNALGLTELRDLPLAQLSGASLTQLWSRHIEEYAVRLGQANQQVMSDGIVRESLDSQQQTLSGVNSDEEAINLLQYQRAYQGSARFLTVVDEMIQTLLNLV